MRAFLLLTLTLATTAVLGSNLVKLNGTVRDEATGLPLQATITYETVPFGNTYGIITTDASTGYYEITLSPENVYKVYVRAIGYITYETKVEIDLATNDRVFLRDFALRPAKAGDVMNMGQVEFAQGESELDMESMAELND
ncbi:MAG: carboxypeptidase-like regulatory domain-containing protein [Cytophagales bacterium]|nr:carboxypeptidase-like regulatory domain-containing protein [Cytophagales bacterium]